MRSERNIEIPNGGCYQEVSYDFPESSGTIILLPVDPAETTSGPTVSPPPIGHRRLIVASSIVAAISLLIAICFA